MAWRVSTSRVRNLARDKGIKNAKQLAEICGISMNTAYRWWNDDLTLQSYDAAMILMFCDLFGCEPGDILIRVRISE
jgi:DNA-binding Xre family transcriptional regulator